jgi:hypothetical protein
MGSLAGLGAAEITVCGVTILAVAAHRLPASELLAGPRRSGEEDKGLRLAGFFGHAVT